jgi:CRP-like cAMP-binding protein/HEAT repeat protein
MHMNANAVSNAIFEPVKTLNYAAIPYRMLGQVRMLVEGVIYPAGIALSGIGLLWLQSVAEPRTTLLVTICLAALFAVVCVGVGAGFLPSLLRSLRQRAAAPAGQTGRSGMSRFSRADVLALENHSDPQVRRYAAELRDKFDTERRTPPVMLLSGRCIRTLARDLEHRSPEARQAAADALSRFGDAAIAEAASRLLSSRPEVAHAAILALGSIGTRRAQQALLDHLRPLYRQARHNLHGLAAMRGFSASGELVSAERVSGELVSAEPVSGELVDVLAAALAASNRRIIWRVLMVKAALGSRRDIRLLHSLAHSSDPRVRADAIEALSSMPTGRFIRPVLALLDAGSNDNQPEIPATEAAGAVLMAASSDRWTRLLAAKLLEGGTLEGGPLGNRITDVATVGEQAMLDLILFLKTVPLFQALTLEEIADLAERAETGSFAAGRVVFEAGEPVRHFAVIRSGTVELSIHGVAVDTITRGASFGENAFLEDARYAVSGTAVTDLVILRFHRAVIGDLVAEHPLVLPPVLGEWQQRVARLYARLADQSAGQQPKQRLQLVHIAEENSRSPDECA